MKLQIKKGDTVQVISGAEKGKKGSVLEVLPKKLKVRVQGVKVQTHFDKKEGLKKLEGLLDYSKIKLVSSAEKSPAKTAKKATATKKKSASATA